MKTSTQLYSLGQQRSCTRRKHYDGGNFDNPKGVALCLSKIEDIVNGIYKRLHVTVVYHGRQLELFFFFF